MVDVTPAKHVLTKRLKKINDTSNKEVKIVVTIIDDDEEESCLSEQPKRDVSPARPLSFHPMEELDPYEENIRILVTGDDRD